MLLRECETRASATRNPKDGGTKADPVVNKFKRPAVPGWFWTCEFAPPTAHPNQRQLVPWRNSVGPIIVRGAAPLLTLGL